MIKKISKTQIPILIIFGFLSTLHFINLNKIPIFGDEAANLYLANLIIKSPSHAFESLKFGIMPLDIWILSFFQFLLHRVFSPLILGRAVNVAAELISSFFIYKICQKLFNKNTAILSAAIYLLLPLNFLESRLALLEPLTNMFLILGLYFETKIIDSQKFDKTKFLNIFLIALFLILSFFTKPLALVSFFGILLLPLFAENKISLQTRILNVIIPGCLVLSIIPLYLPISGYFSRYIADNRNLSFIIPHSKFNLWRIFLWTKIYLTIPLILTSILGFIYNLFFIKSFKINWLLFFIISIIIMEALFGQNFYPRHLYFLAVPFSIICGFFLYQVLYLNKFFFVSLMLVALFFPLKLDSQIIFSPQTATIVPEDKQQLFEDWSSGVGDEQIANKLKEISKNQTITVFVEDEPSQSWAIANLYDIGNTQIIPSHNLLIGQFIEDQAIKNVSTEKYFILNKNQSAPKDWPSQLILSVPKGPSRTINLYKLNSF